MQARKPSPLVDDNLVYAQFSHCEAPIECNEAPNGYSRGARRSQSLCCCMYGLQYVACMTACIYCMYLYRRRPRAPLGEAAAQLSNNSSWPACATARPENLCRARHLPGGGAGTGLEPSLGYGRSRIPAMASSPRCSRGCAERP